MRDLPEIHGGLWQVGWCEGCERVEMQGDERESLPAHEEADASASVSKLAEVPHDAPPPRHARRPVDPPRPSPAAVSVPCHPCQPVHASERAPGARRRARWPGSCPDEAPSAHARRQPARAASHATVPYCNVSSLRVCDCPSPPASAGRHESRVERVV